MPHKTYRLSPARQHGFVLVACLIILLVLTVLGVNAMGTGSLERRMAANNQSKIGSLQSADSAAQSVIAFANANFGANDIDNAIAQQTTLQSNYTFNTDSAVTKTTYDPTKQGIAPDYSITKYNMYLVYIDSAATNANTNAQSELVQTVTRLAPK